MICFDGRPNKLFSAQSPAYSAVIHSWDEFLSVQKADTQDINVFRYSARFISCHNPCQEIAHFCTGKEKRDSLIPLLCNKASVKHVASSTTNLHIVGLSEIWINWIINYFWNINIPDCSRHILITIQLATVWEEMGHSVHCLHLVITKTVITF